MREEEPSEGGNLMNRYRVDEFNPTELPCCPVCYECATVEITEDEKFEALALWDLYDFIGRLEILTQQYRCVKCGYQW